MKCLCQKKINNENCWLGEYSMCPVIEALTAETLNLSDEEHGLHAILKSTS